jgi:hypothetical protein
MSIEKIIERFDAKFVKISPAKFDGLGYPEPESEYLQLSDSENLRHFLRTSLEEYGMEEYEKGVVAGIKKNVFVNNTGEPISIMSNGKEWEIVK